MPSGGGGHHGVARCGHVVEVQIDAMLNPINPVGREVRRKLLPLMGCVDPNGEPLWRAEPDPGGTSPPLR